MVFRYPAFIDIDGDEVIVRFHDFPEIFCAGLDEEEALFNAIEALTIILAQRMDQKYDLPFPTRNVDGAIYVTPNPIVQSALRSHFQLDRFKLSRHI